MRLATPERPKCLTTKWTVADRTETGAEPSRSQDPAESSVIAGRTIRVGSRERRAAEPGAWVVSRGPPPPR